ncbi:minichromosome maintenance domain-containing protein 2-like [Halichondria panicea]|uniref:minichromosome maintenance domain-containing protein 2-like n=1 Tax=Halichondria panicea TaxID=6063 RepID=UPI00312BB125
MSGLESGYVEVSVPKRLGVSELQAISLPFSCALWGITRHTEASTISKSLFDRLGLVLSCDPTPCYEDSLSATITRHTLDTAMGYSTLPLLSPDIITELVFRATTIEPILEESAESLLESFYVGSRRVRGSDMPNTALDTMKAMALSHAKLRLRKTATQDDALLAVLFYEECLVGRFGETLYAVL